MGNSHPLEVEDRGSETQFEVRENLNNFAGKDIAQCWFTVGPLLITLIQHFANVVSKHRICWSV